MNLDPGVAHRSPSPTSSERSTPIPRVERQTAEEGVYKADKALRRYGATIERVLGSWEVSPLEWADYIAFLGRLLKAIQSYPKDAPLLPHSDDIASKLAQCLNPALPSGVHQKALEVYGYIFSTFGQEYVSHHLDDFLPGLSAVLSFASLSVRPGLYAIFEDYIVRLPTSVLHPVLKSLILSLLPALEDETSEDFERAFGILETLEEAFSSTTESHPGRSDREGYFWQCLFLAVITSPSRRQGSLNYLARRLPKFGPIQHKRDGANSVEPNGTTSIPLPAPETVLSPEPGLLIRCFVCGLSDTQILIQRGFLDLLVTNMPLNSPLLRERVGEYDWDRLVSAAIQVLLRREMSLNRRLWSWFLGPDPKENVSDSQPSSPATQRKPSFDARSNLQFEYFSSYGRAALERCILAMLTLPISTASNRARPFRICLSLMDRWEIGGPIVPHIFLPAMESAYRYNLVANPNDTAELVRSASLFFDGIEASLIWANLLSLLKDTYAEQKEPESLQVFVWIIQRFNIKEEEMLVTHIPYAIIYLLILTKGALNSDAEAERMSAALDIVSMMLDLVPERAFTSSTKKFQNNKGISSTSYDMANMRKSVDDFYRTTEQPIGNKLPISGWTASEVLYELLASLMLQGLRQNSQWILGRAVSILLALQSKASNSEVLRNVGLFDEIFHAVESAMTQGPLLSLPTISSLISLLSALASDRHEQPYITIPEIVRLEPVLTPQIWHYLSPSVPKYHVEAVKSIWQLQDLVTPDDCLQSSLTALMRQNHDLLSILPSDSAESARRFATLWSHTVLPTTSNSIPGVSKFSRRGSTMPSLSDAKAALRRQAILAEPLMLALDLLNDPNGVCLDAVKRWIQSLPTLEQVLSIHFEMMDDLVESMNEIQEPEDRASERRHTGVLRDIEYIIDHFHSIVTCGNSWTWDCLNDMSLAGGGETEPITGIVMLAERCIRFICNKNYASHGLKQKAMTLLDALLSGPSAVSLKTLELDSRLIDCLIYSMHTVKNDLQGPILQLLTQSLKVRSMDGSSQSLTEGRPSSSTSVKRSSLAGGQPSPNASTATLTATPPAQLLHCLQLGFSSSSARSHLDQWIEFLSRILPLFADAIFTNLIPLVDCFCTELDKTHDELISVAKVKGEHFPVAPDATAMALLDALEMILARAHECLIDEHNAETVPKGATQPRSLLGNMTSGVFRAEGPPSRTAQANSRLTIILAYQDAIRVSLKLWIWASHYSDIADFDKTSAATTSYNAIRIRNRTRHLLEEIFAVEPLESLEVVISTWCYAADHDQAGASLDLLHVMHGSRPKNIVPAILDALCSRTNPAALPAARQSSQTIDLAASDIAIFLSAYLQSIEDDATDEVWPDSTAFLRDVLANPLPFRQILPPLLSAILLLAQKVDNTNFGEQRKMRRDLGDIFLRLLAATFTTMPSGYVTDPAAYESQSSAENESNSAIGQKSMSLDVVLKNVTTNIDVILETPDRIASAVNSISASYIAPLLHAKSFPTNVSSNALALLLQMARKAPSTKSWKKDIADAFGDAKLLSSSVRQMEHDWYPVLHHWSLHDKERMPELLSRLMPPSSAGIMFGVGANAARLDADRRTQLNLRRVCILLLASPEDTFVTQSRVIEEKLVELFEANTSSSPSSTIKAELFMLCCALALSTSAVHLSPIWPIINDNLQSALNSLLPNASNRSAFANLSLFQACKLLDLLVVISPDEFQLHQWLYVSDTIDAVYQPFDWNPAALSDQIATALSLDATEDSTVLATPTGISSGVSGRRRPLIDNISISDKEDIKAMTRDDFAKVVLRPFLSQLSLHVYEGVYSMDTPDLSICRRNLLEDILDLTTIVE